MPIYRAKASVFEIPEAAIIHTRDPADFSHLLAVDLGCGFFSRRNVGASHPFAAVLGCWDRDGDVIYIVHAISMRQALPIAHVDGNESPSLLGRAGCLAARRRHDRIWVNGDICRNLSTRHGLNMLSGPRHVSERGGFNFESGISEMEHRFATGRLKIAQHLGEIFDEFRGYHRINGLVHKVDDDLLSAIRVLCMDIRRAKVLDPQRPGQPGAAMFPRNRAPQFAKGIDFPLFGE